MHTRHLPWIAAACLLAVSALTACGQKGPLYLPGESPQPVVLPGAGPTGDDAAARPAGAPEDEEEDEKEGDGETP